MLYERLVYSSILHILYIEFILRITPYFIKYISGFQITIKYRIGRKIMKYTIYIDVFFMVNLAMDTILLKLASSYIKPHTTFLRCLAGGAVGSLTSSLSLFLSYDNMIVHMFITYIFTAMAMVVVAFGKCSISQLMKRMLALYFVTILTGGAMNLVYDYTYFGYMLHGIFSSVFASPMSLVRMMVYTGISYAVLWLISRMMKQNRSVSHYAKVKLCLKGKSVTLTGLIDSGNSLIDPYYGKIVHIAEYSSLQKILEGVDIHSEKYRLVPFHSLGRRNGLVEVIEFDEIVVSMAGRMGDDEQIIYTEKNPAIGLYHASLSGDKKYEMLLQKSVAGEDFV